MELFCQIAGLFIIYHYVKYLTNLIGISFSFKGYKLDYSYLFESLSIGLVFGLYTILISFNLMLGLTMIFVTTVIFFLFKKIMYYITNKQIGWLYNLLNDLQYLILIAIVFFIKELF